MEIYNLLQIGYTKNLEEEDAEIIDIIQRIDYEIKKKEQREVERQVRKRW